MQRLLLGGFALLLVLAGLLVAPPTPIAAQGEGQPPVPPIEGRLRADPGETDPAEAASAAARELSRLEADGDFAALYDRLHPDSQALAPRAAVVGWYEAELTGKTTAELTVTDVTFFDWTWEVTGRTYRDTASISFVQPYWTGGVRADVAAVLHLVEADGEWGWFFGASQVFIDQQIALYAPAAPAAPSDPSAPEPDAIVAAGAAARAVAFPDPLHAHVDAFWAREFAIVDRPYDPPNGVVGFAEPITTRCGTADPTTEAAFYCVLDETIYYSVAFRTTIETRIGDFGWIVVVAHEWGHHIQLQLGADLVGALDQSGDLAPIDLEQQADCLAGAYTVHAESTGWLDPGDVDEAIFMTGISGDPPGTAWDDPFAHGSGPERVDAFLTGYAGGILSCDLEL